LPTYYQQRIKWRQQKPNVAALPSPQAKVNRRKIVEDIRIDNGISESVIDSLAGLIDRLDGRIASLAPEDVIEWISNNIRLDDDATSLQKGKIHLDPWQVKPIKTMCSRGVDLVVTIAPEQYGKSMCWKTAYAYKTVFHGGPKLIVYEEKKKAAQINRRTFHPILMGVPEIREQLGSWKVTNSSYDFHNGVIDFTGAGADITSQTYRDVVADEYDTWPLVFAKKKAQLMNLEKRRKVYSRHGLGCLVVCSSCKGTEDDSSTWQEFETTSMEYWTLRCLACGALSMPSHMFDGKRDPHTGQFVGGLHFEQVNHVVIDESVRLQCPTCGHMHTQDDMTACNEQGDYVATHAERTKRRGFVGGGLGCPRVATLAQLAQQRVAAGNSNEFEAQRTYHNSYRGVAMPINKKHTEQKSGILNHCMAWPTDGEIRACYLVADTQESPWGWYWIVRGIDTRWNTWLLDCGFATDKQQLKTRIIGQYSHPGGHGMTPTFCLIDQGGTNAEQVKELAAEHASVWQYKGASHPQGLWTVSKGQPKLILADADRLQVMLLRAIYDQDDRTNNYWALPPMEDLPRNDDPSFDYLTNLSNVRATEGDKGHLRQNWTCQKNERRDFFDCEKMGMVLTGMPIFRKAFEAALAGRPNGLKLSEIQAQKRR